jgi:carbon monoxide dehydrogenase subunit G
MRYRGPSLDELHDRYAKDRRIDRDAPIIGEHQMRIGAPIKRVWGLVSDPDRWPAIDPAISDVRVEGPVAPDTRFVWRNGSAKLRSRFAIVDPLREVSWTGSSMGARAVHRYTFESVGASSTVVRTEESMAGKLIAVFYSSDKLCEALVSWLDAVRMAAERH